MEHPTVSWVVKMIEGIVALCLGTSVRVTWLGQAGATAYSDDDQIYLPNPIGETHQEYESLLVMTMQEVAKHFTQEVATSHPEVSPDAQPYAFALEAARIKTVMAQTFMAVTAMLDDAARHRSQSTTPEQGDPSSQLQGGESSQPQADDASEGTHPDQTGEAEPMATQGGQAEPGSQSRGEDATDDEPMATSQGEGNSAGPEGESHPAPSSDQQGAGGSAEKPTNQESADAQAAGSQGGDDAAPVEPVADEGAMSDQLEQTAADAALADEGNEPLTGHAEGRESGNEADPCSDVEDRAAMVVPLAVIDREGEPSAEAITMLCELGGGEFVQCQAPEANSLLSGVSGHLVGVLLRAFQDRRRRPFLRAHSGRDLAISHAWKFKHLGDARVFRRKTLACGVDAAVSILLDTSSSMAKRMIQAVSVTYALALAFQRIPGVKTSIDVFPGPGVAFEEILKFKQNINSARRRLEMVAAGGGTPTGSAMRARLQQLLATRAEKKVMIVVTDGQPNLNEQSLTMEMVSEAQANDVSVIGIGIDAKIGSFFPHHVDVNSVDELASALEALFKSELAGLLAA